MQVNRSRRTHRTGSTSTVRYVSPGHRAVIESLEERRLLAGVPELLADMGVVNDLRAGNFTEAGGTVYFTGQVAGWNEVELWKTDGTPAGTKPVKDLTDLGSSNVMNLTEFNGSLYFGARDDAGYGLWKSDGTDAGTLLVKRLEYLPGATNFSNLTNADGTLYFLTEDRNSTWDVALWKSDGTTEGTVMVKELPQYSSISNGGITAVGDGIFIEGASRALWHSDGTPEGTSELKKFDNVWENANVHNFTNVDGTLYFTAAGDGLGVELWKSDGTVAGTTLVKDIRAGSATSNVSGLTNVDGTLYFVATDGTGYEYWKSNGTDAGTVPVDGLVQQQFNLSNLRAAAGHYFYGDSVSSGVYQLWQTDLTAAGSSVVPGVPLFTTMEVLGDKVYLVAKDTWELWTTDGTAEGTHAVLPLSVGMRIQGVGSKLFLAAQKSVGLTDGTVEGTQLLDPFPKRLVGGGVSDVTQVNDIAYFGGRDDRGFELWRTDGTPANTKIVKDILPGSGSSGVSLLTNLNGALYFVANDGTHGKELWRSDGTETGTQMVVDLTTGDTNFGELLNVGGTLYFTTVNDGTSRLWKTDGTAEGTVGLSARPARSLRAADGGLYFFATGDDGTEDLWKSDGTMEGTELVAEIVPARPSSPRPDGLTATGNRVYFWAEGAQFRDELWISDGTAAGTHRVTAPGLNLVNPGILTNVNGLLYFTAWDGADDALWKTDGSEAGTQRIQYLRVANRQNSTALFQGAMYFGADDGLWRSDGTEGGTVNITPELGDYTILDVRSRFVEFDSSLYFVAADTARGEGLWRTDGTSAGTEFVMDISPSRYLHLETNLAAALDVLIFNADAGETGFDPWVIRSASPEVVGRHLFYNDSAFDGKNSAANADDDGAIAPDKIAYRPGTGAATTASVSSYVRGINGIMVDIAGLDATLSADDFTFRVGTTGDPESWELAPAPMEVVVREGAGTGGSDRVTITWNRGEIENTWLQVIVRGNDALGGFNTNSGLTESDVFYYGSRVGDSFVAATALATVTSARDEVLARNNAGFGVPIANPYDYNRDGVVSSADQGIARSSHGILMMLDVDDIVETLVKRPTPESTGDTGLAFALAIAGMDDEGADEDAAYGAVPTVLGGRAGRRR